MNTNFKFDRNATIARLTNAKNKAIRVVTERALTDSNKYCKFDQGELIASSKKASKPEEGLMIWDTVYAKRQYYLDSANTDDNPDAQKMWAHVAHSKHNKEWRQVMQDEFKRQAKK